MRKELPVNTVICGDSLSVLRTFPDKSIDMCMTSPPYWGLRDYGVEQIFGGSSSCEHEWGNHQTGRVSGGGDRPPQTKWKAVAPNGNYDSQSIRSSCLKCQAWKGQLGLEPTPEFYIEHLTEIFSEVKRVLKEEGTLWLNIGDTYGGSGGDYKEWHKNDAGFQGKLMRGCQPKKLIPKCLCMIPERLAWSLIQDGWILRNKIVWYKPNAMPSSVTDRFSNRYEFIYMFSKQQKYYFDLDAVREATISPEGIASMAKGYEKFATKHSNTSRINQDTIRKWNPAGKNPGDVFEVNTQPFPEAHFAVFSEKLCEKPIKAGCPEEVCKKCGKARERITEKVDIGEEYSATIYPNRSNAGALSRKRQAYRKMGMEAPPTPKMIGWTSCSCNAGFEGGILLDPFCGAGTALLVAKEMKRRYIGIDIKQEFKEMSEKRLAQGIL